MKPSSRSLTNFFKHLLFVVKVEGESAFPELLPGSYYLATSLRKPKPGNFIVFTDPNKPSRILVKKVRSISNEGLAVESVVSWGTSSENFGLISQKNVRGIVIR